MRKINNAREKGIALILNAIMLTFTIATVGLAVDVGTLYMIKGRMSAALDAAALAAGRSVNLANSIQAAQTAATNTATAFFNANFPSGYMGTTGSPTVNANLTQETDANGNYNGVLDIAVNAQVGSPTYFMNIFNISNVTVAAKGTASRRGLVMMLVLDQSSSMNTSTTPTACQNMVTAAQNFITLFSPYDQIGLVTFDYTAHMIYAPSTSYQNGTLNTDIGNITCGNNTNTTSALQLAYQQIQNVNLPLAENVIVLFTDGSPNGISANFPVKTVVDSRWGPAASSPAPPAQSGNTYGQPNSCVSGNAGPPTGSNRNGVCVNMPAACTASGTVRGTLVQWASQDPNGGDQNGLFLPMDGDSSPVYPAGCNGTGSNIKQTIAYIPDTDVYGNNTHGVPATVAYYAGSTIGQVGPATNLVTRDFWLFQLPTANYICAPDQSVQPNCKSLGDLWANWSTGSQSNYFQSGNPYYAPNAANATNNYVLRPDQPNTVVAASMNTAMDEAYRIRNNSTLHTMIHTIYLTGNATDAVDREFLPIIANTPNITALPYDPVTYTAYANPAFQRDQEQGIYLVTADSTQLKTIFAELASEVLRISQ